MLLRTRTEQWAALWWTLNIVWLLNILFQCPSMTHVPSLAGSSTTKQLSVSWLHCSTTTVRDYCKIVHN